MDVNPFERRLPLFPTTTAVDAAGRLTIAGHEVEALAEQYGTPLYLYDQATLDASLDEYRFALSTHYPAESALTYAGKAFLSLAMAQWVMRNELTLDCTGAGEIAIATAAGVGRAQVLVHGVAKSGSDLDAAFERAGVLVVDNLLELERIRAYFARHPDAQQPELWLRLRPGVAVQTHHQYTQTGQDDSKFGMSPTELLEALRRAKTYGLKVTGLHFHQGSHFHEPAPLAPALEMALDLAAETQTALGWMPQVICPGGGWGVPYHEDDLPHPPIETYVAYIAAALVRGCRDRRLPLPRLQLEPGRSLAARAGVAVYRVEAVKRTPHRRWLLIDGGMADNPRPALYRARYSALPAVDPQRPAIGGAYIGGPFCESGDVLIEDLPMADVQPGEFIAMPVAGAYQLSMGSNYNGARRPAVLWLCPPADGGPKALLIRRREAVADLFAHDLLLP